MKTLLIIDVQNDFLPQGALPVREGDQIVSLINELMPHYDQVLATQDFHPADHGSFAANHADREPGEVIDLNGLQQILWPTHCVQGTAGTDFAPELNTAGINRIFPKGTDPAIDSYSGFFDNGHRKSTGLADYLRKIGTTELHLVGLATDYCVKFSALDAIAEGFNTTLITDACRGVDLTPGDVDRAIDDMAAAGVQLVTTRDLLGDTATLYRPVGPNELALLADSDYREWPSRLLGQPIFYPVLNEDYANQIATEWNTKESGSGYVTRFKVLRTFLAKYPRQVVGGQQHEELWIPAADLEELNKHLVGPIEVVQRHEPNINQEA